MEIPKIKLKLTNKTIIISDLTLISSARFDEKEYENFYLDDYVIIKDKDIKLFLVNLALHYYENYTYFFEQSNNIIPFWKNKIEIKKRVVSHLSPKKYFKYITDNLDEDWYVQFKHNSFRGAGETNFPEIWIIPNSELLTSKTKCSELKNKAVRIFDEYVVQKYTHSFDAKNNRLCGKVIIINKGGGGLSDKYGLWFDHYYLFTSQCLTNAFLEQTSKSYLRDGIYEIEAEYVSGIEDFGVETSGFIIKKANLVKDFGENNEWLHKKHIMRDTYRWGTIVNFASFFNKFIKWPAIKIIRETLNFVLFLILFGVAALIIWATIIKPILN